MAKGNRKGSRRRGGDDSSDDDEVRDNDDKNKAESQEQQQEQHGADVVVENVSENSDNLGFAERRELQRRKAAQKRRLRQRCFLCGKSGHVRRECPGVADDGRGHSKYAKAKGDAGAVTLKASGRNKSNKLDTNTNSTCMIAGLELPDGFESQMMDTDDVERSHVDPFLYYDSMCDGFAILQYLQNGRSGLIFQKTKDEAVEEFRRILSKSITMSNFGGCIAQVYLKTNQKWNTETLPPLPWWDDENETFDPISVHFVLGLNHGYDCVNEAEKSRAVLEGASRDPRVVGFCTKIDYSDVGFDREAQLARVYCTCDVAVEVHLPVQIQLLHEPVVRSESGETDSHSSYAMALRDLLQVLQSPRYVNLKVHLCSWSGLSEDMTGLLERFPTTLWIGIDGTVSFSKATIAHECAFDIPMNKLMLEIGSNIPSQVASALGRQAFPHSGLIPFVAAAVAQHKKYVSAEQVARAASQNTMTLYKIPR